MKIEKLAAALCLLSLGACSPSSRGPKKLRIAVIPKGSTHEFWRIIHAGALKAKEELDKPETPVEIIWKGPLREDDREQQIQVVEGFASQGVDGIVLAPLDEKALVRPVEEARQLGIPTLVIDSNLDSDQIVSFVATDNEKGGALAAQELGRLLGGKGKAILLRYQEGSASTSYREKGFLAKMKEAYPGVELISTDQYAGATRDTGKRASENLMNRFGSEVQAIFTCNETSTAGMLLTLEDMKKAGHVAFVGFDANEAFVEALRSKHLNGIVVQSPFNMAYLGVKTLVEALRGQSVPRRIDTGVTLVTPDNMDTPEVQALLHPPVEKYLSQ
jgi:ribose transport system substrate-binding protein